MPRSNHLGACPSACWGTRSSASSSWPRLPCPRSIPVKSCASPRATLGTLCTRPSGNLNCLSAIQKEEKLKEQKYKPRAESGVNTQLFTCWNILRDASGGLPAASRVESKAMLHNREQCRVRKPPTRRYGLKSSFNQQPFVTRSCALFIPL